MGNKPENETRKGDGKWERTSWETEKGVGNMKGGAGGKWEGERERAKGQAMGKGTRNSNLLVTPPLVAVPLRSSLSDRGCRGPRSGWSTARRCGPIPKPSKPPNKLENTATINAADISPSLPNWDARLPSGSNYCPRLRRLRSTIHFTPGQ